MDLRLKEPKSVQFDFEVGKPSSFENLPIYDSLPPKPKPELNFAGISVPHHLTRQLMSYFPKATREPGLALDLGCGNTIHKDVCEYAGFKYVGLDYQDLGAPILGDAHALPFEDDSFDFILSIAVLEHIQFPFVMIREACRVLKSSGSFIGTVSFLEPFHADSYYHHSHLGLLNTLRYGGFDVELLAANEESTVFDAQARMASWIMFPSMPQRFSSAIIRFPKVMMNLWWRIGQLKRSKGERQKNTKKFTGSFSFVARKH